MARAYTFLIFIFFIGSFLSQVEDCSNGIDDDADGLIDCQDSECSATILTPINDTMVCESFTLPTISGIGLTGNQAFYDFWPSLGGNQITGPILTDQTIYIFDGYSNCSDSLSFNVLIGSTPTLSITDPPVICEPQTHDLTDPTYVSASAGILSYYTDSSLSTFVQDATSASNGIYFLELNNNGCIVNGTLNATILHAPTKPIAGHDSLYCNGQYLNNLSAIASENGLLTWYSDYTLITEIGNGPQFNPYYALGVTPYYVTETISNGCESEASVVSITIIECELKVPTAITPDGNLLNDTWDIIDIDEIYPDNIIRIFNRWGDLIFEHNSNNGVTPYWENQWDGTKNGIELPVGSYYYIIEFNDINKNSISGAVSIIN